MSDRLQGWTPPHLDEAQLAALATYIRNDWGNAFSGVSPEEVTTTLAELPTTGERATIWDGVGTEEQAERGRAFYSGTCAKCHGRRGNGAETSMSRFLALALGLPLFLLPLPTSAQTTPAKPSVMVTCEVMGHDLIVYNRTDADLEPGTTIRWSAWNGKREGEHTLTEPLVPHVGLQLSGALQASYLWDRPCEAYIAPAQNQLDRNGKIHLQGGKGNVPVSTK